jgi:hypothetical protein
VRNDDTIRLEKPVTTVTAKPMTSAVSNCTVTASAEHTPNIKTVIGLFLPIGAVSSFQQSPLLFPVFSIFKFQVFSFKF